MEENERDLHENQINDTAVGEDTVAAEPSETEETEISTPSDILPAESAEGELPASLDESREISDTVEIPEKPLYTWDYDAQKKLDEKNTRAKNSKAAIIYASVMTAAFLVSFAVLLVLLLTNLFSDSTEQPQAPSASGNGTSTNVVYVKEYSPESGVLTTQEIYTRSLPSIVSISVSSSSSSGVGSGFIISEDGYIVTANHVISGMSQITVILSNNEMYTATVIDGNEFTDLALIKIEKTGLPYLEIGSSSSLLVGDHVVAIGTPASVDFAGSLADGTVSFNNRVFKIYNDSGAVEKKMTLIQTNALVNPGNSGCPLINQYGKVVGIVTMKLNSTYFEGMCFAIPTDTAMPIINAMRNGENYDSLLSAVSQYPAKLGIMVENATGNVSGVKISGFTSSSYDISKKMAVGDVITDIDSIAVSSINHLSQILDLYSPGDTVKITFYRSGQKMTVDVVLGK